MMPNTPCPLKPKVIHWYDGRRISYAPSFGRLWGLACRIRWQLDMWASMTDEELLELTFQAIDYCLVNFNPSRSKRLDLPIEKRFATFFCMKLKGMLGNWNAKRLGDWNLIRKYKKHLKEKVVKVLVSNSLKENAIEWVRARVEALPPVEREIVHQRFYESKPDRTIGNSLGMTDCAVRKRLQRTLNNMREIAPKWCHRIGKCAVSTVHSHLLGHKYKEVSTRSSSGERSLKRSGPAHHKVITTRLIDST